MFDFCELGDDKRFDFVEIASGTLDCPLLDVLIFFFDFKLDRRVNIPMIELTTGSCQIVVSYSPGNRCDITDFLGKLSLSRFFYMVFIVRNSAAEEKLFVFGDHEGAIGKADCLSDWS